MNYFVPLLIFIFSSTIFLAKNPVYGVLSFVVVVAQIVLLLIGLNLEFLAYTLAIVYIGAIVVLFLFVIMMFHIKEGKQSRTVIRGILEYTVLGSLVAILFAAYAFYSIFEHIDYSELMSGVEFANLLGYLLFNDLAALTLAAALIMFVGIVGTIILTIKQPSSTRVGSSKIRSTVRDTIEHRN